MRSIERGRACEQVAQHLNAIAELTFRVTPISLRDRYTPLITRKANQLKYEEGASGIQVIQTELDILLQEILEKERETKQQLELEAGDKKKKEENAKISAEDVTSKQWRASLKLQREKRKKKVVILVV